MTPTYNIKMIKPIIKWIGGKTQIIDKILNKIPKEIDNYHEIFVGGGSVLFGVLEEKKITKNIYAYDINNDLINMYKTIQTKPNELYKELTNIIDKFNKCNGEKIIKKPKTEKDGMTSKESYYYWLRKEYNNIKDDNIRKSSLFIFLNKTCFRGIFRTSKNGFNVPYGHYKNPEIINKEHLDIVSNLIKNVIFISCDFKKAIKNINENDFAYLDPPYVPLNTKSFVGYTENGFNEHKCLFDLCKKMKNKFLMSNVDIKIIRDEFIDYKLETLICKRTINSKNPASKCSELLITNY